MSLLSHEDRKDILVIGSGGREHAITWKLRQSGKLGKLFVAPGNGGTADYNVPIKSDELDKLAEFAKKQKCLTLVGPEAPLEAGIVDRFALDRLPIFGPTREQAKLETSKVYSKEFMKRLNIPTAEFKMFDELQPALDYTARSVNNLVVKVDGLAAGKGVFVCKDSNEAEAALRLIFEKKYFGKAGERVIIEKKLEGREISFMALSDGKSAVPFGTAMDHKRALDGDQGPNTGGMGAFSPADKFDSAYLRRITHDILEPTVQESGFRGFLYLGLMLDENNNPKVLEYNARLGDPETQVILPRLESDLVSCVSSIISGSSSREVDLDWNSQTACTVVMCSEGYPQSPKVDDEIHGVEKAGTRPDVFVFHSGTVERNRTFFTNGGRVLSVTGMGNSKADSVKRAYEAVNLITWRGEHHRKDIGASK
ncbi:MAG: phosphoribosylamine--glycine ligase [Thaumarchaeota archaeon]|nr:phosphoribosylamine--glycine ligase [Nitrososphaerota archaeon]